MDFSQTASMPTGLDAAEVTGLVKAAVIDSLNLEPADFDWGRSLAEMGCDSLSVIDIQFQLEQQLGVSDLGLGGPLDFDPVKAPLARLEQHVRTILRPA